MKISATLFLLFALTLCCLGADTLSKQAAIRAAGHAAEVAGFHLADYKKPKAEFVIPCGGDHREWWISYEPRVPLRATNAMGTSWITNRLCVVVDPKTSATTFAKTPEPD